MSHFRVLYFNQYLCKNPECGTVVTYSLTPMPQSPHPCICVNQKSSPLGEGRSARPDEQKKYRFHFFKGTSFSRWRRQGPGPDKSKGRLSALKAHSCSKNSQLHTREAQRKSNRQFMTAGQLFKNFMYVLYVHMYVCVGSSLLHAGFL